MDALPGKFDKSPEPNLEFLFHYSDLNDKFYVAVIEAARSTMLRWTLDRLRGVPFAAPGATIISEGFGTFLDLALEQHQPIIEAIAGGDAERTENVARQHARLARKNLEFALQRGVPGSSLVKVDFGSTHASSMPPAS